MTRLSESWGLLSRHFALLFIFRGFVIFGLLGALVVSDAGWPIVTVAYSSAWLALLAVELTQPIEPGNHVSVSPQAKLLLPLGEAFSMAAAGLIVIFDFGAWWFLALILALLGGACWRASFRINQR